MSEALLLFLTNAVFFSLGDSVWGWMMGMVTGVLGLTPETFSGGAWGYVSGTLYPVTLSVGVLFLNITFLAGFFRQASNIKQNFTWEILIELAIKALLANVLMQGGLGIMQGLFRAAAGLADAAGGVKDFSAAVGDIDAGTTLFGCLFGIIYFMVCLVCGGMIFLSVYGRFLQLYVLTACAPLALPFLAGGQGVERTAASFIRAFLGKCFEVVVIVIFLGVGTRLCRGIDWGDMDGVAGWFDGAGKCMQNMVTMVLMAASVKGADSFMRRVFGL